MASFAPIRGTAAQIALTPLVDGQFLVETDQGDQNKSYIDAYVDGVLTRSMCGGGGHEMVTNTPVEGSGGLRATIRSATNSNEQVVSAYGVQQWSNVLTTTIFYDDNPLAQGVNTIGTWVDDAYSELVEATPSAGDDPSALGWYELDETNHVYQQTSDSSVVADKKYWSSIIDESDWWYNQAFVGILSNTLKDNITFNIAFDPEAGKESLVLAGYILDDTTGRLCVKLANKTTTATNVIAAEVTLKQTLG